MQLIKVELMKISSKKSFKLILISIILICGLVVFISNKKTNINIDNYLDILYTEESVKEVKNFTEEIVMKNNYIYTNDFNNNLKVKQILESSYTISLFLSIVLCALACISVSKEFSKGSIRILLLKPNLRCKVLLSKLTSILIISTFLLLIVFISMMFWTTIICNINIFNIKELVIENNKVLEINYIISFIKNYWLYTIPIFFITVLAFSLATIFLSESFSLAISIFIFLLSTSLAQMCLNYNLNFITYTFLPYLDFTLFNDKINLFLLNQEYNINLNIYSGIIILIIYGIIFYSFSNFLFCKRDIKN